MFYVQPVGTRPEAVFHGPEVASVEGISKNSTLKSFGGTTAAVVVAGSGARGKWMLDEAAISLGENASPTGAADATESSNPIKARTVE
ncbi:hypothetical protein TWF594_007632 [Orbilia oligospora]|nr:hypothetical protein TWF594_007632 [Orbilia oligospora]KAF3293404.1 hypothetical protein TWF132_004724 [Orbilia oligospora]